MCDTQGHQDEHDLGLIHDLEHMARKDFGRRQTLRLLLSGASVALVTACGGSDSESSATTTTTTATPTPTTTTTTTTTTTDTTTSSGSCIADPSETNGPYPADGSNSANGSVVNVLTQSGIVRNDIRSSFGSYSGTADGITTQLTITLVNVNGSCAPLSGYAIYIWHCTTDGDYSLYNLTQQNYLRGVAVTDANGQVTFTTIFPGCYSGRYPHIHFEVYPSVERATTYANRVLCSQFALPSAACSAVYATSDYASSRTNFAGTSLSTDGIFGDNTSAQVAAMTIVMTGDTTNGYTGTVTVGVAV